MPKALVDTFAKQANTTLETFKHQQKADQEVVDLVHTAAQVDPLVYSLQLNPQTTSRWERLRTELHQIAQAYGIRTLPGSAAGERFCGLQHYRNLSQCCGYRALTAAGERMHTGFARDSPAMQCAECVLADRGRDQERLRADWPGRSGVLRGVSVVSRRTKASSRHWYIGNQGGVIWR
jgi:hypothetical protein